MLSKTADYALRALLVLGTRDAGRPLTAESIAELTGAPSNYMSKTLGALAKAGLVRGTRGPTGGFALATAADEISIARIADLFREAASSPRCLLGNGPCNPDAPCAAHRRWRALAAATRRPLVTTTLADLLEDARSVPASPDDHAAGAAGIL